MRSRRVDGRGDPTVDMTRMVDLGIPEHQMGY
jgi:hypothetical protein